MNKNKFSNANEKLFNGHESTSEKRFNYVNKL